MAELAERFGVSYGYTKKIRKQQLRSGRMERVPQRYGGRRRATPEVQAGLREMIRQQPDLTLAEMQQRLSEADREQWSLSGLWRVMGRMGLRLKKSRSTPKSKTRRRPASAVRRGGTK